jgi:hypothetical protein
VSIEMINKSQEQLAKRCKDVETLALAAQDWVRDPVNAELVGAERRSLLKTLHDGARRARRLARSAGTRMSVSVYGPSQAGKSFLVSVLASPAGGRLVADYAQGGTEGFLDYISEINPEGEGESTGLVTRFTMARAATPAGFPVTLHLLSQSDLARTLVNSFFNDGDGRDTAPEPEELQAHIDRFRARKQAQPVPGMDGDDVMDIADYVQTGFGNVAYASALRSLWDEAAGILPFLGLQDRAEFLSILWGGHALMTQLFLRLIDAMARLDNAATVHASLAALVPRETSIIDVKILRGLESDPATAPRLEVRTPQGKVVQLGRAELCALSAELVLPMREEPAPLFAQTDLLDFPGARNRFKRPFRAIMDEGPKTLPELLLRGKVAYLFDRYVAEQEITSMLLCIPDSNMETTDLPGLVESWIATTHGARPELRARTACILFFVLTKFDKHLGESSADSGLSSRFDKRIYHSLQEKFRLGSDNWVDNWTPGQPFRNCFWVRNPSYYVEGLLDYEGTPPNKREVRVRADKVARLAEIRSGYLDAENVQRHFSDPAAAWDAALALNDGGVGYLVAALTRVCTPDSKINQISGQLQTLTERLHGSLAPLYVSDDLDAHIAARRDAAYRVIDGIENAFNRHRLGSLVASLMVDQDAIEERIIRVPVHVRLSHAVAAPAGPVSETPSSATPVPMARPGGILRPGRAGPVAAAPGLSRPDQEPAAVQVMTLEQFQAQTAIETWIDRLKQFRDSATTHAALGIEAGQAADLVADLIHLARRKALSETIARELGGINFGADLQRKARAAAILCAERINGFVAALGCADLPERARPQVVLGDGATRPVFAMRGRADDVRDLSPVPRPIAPDYAADLAFALESVFLENARDVEGGERDIEQNRRLGAVVTGLQGVMA